MASAALHRPGAQRQLRERIEPAQMVCLLHSALSEPPAKRACVSEERYSAAVSLRLPGVHEEQLVMRRARARRGDAAFFLVCTLRAPRDAKVHIGCMLWPRRTDECEPRPDSDFCTIRMRGREKIVNCTCARMSGMY